MIFYWKRLSIYNQTEFFSTRIEYRKFRIKPSISFTPDDSTRDFLSFKASTLYEDYNRSANPINDTSSFEKFFQEADIAHGLIFKGNRKRRFQKVTLVVDPGFQYIEKSRGAFQWYMIKLEDYFKQ